MSGITSRFPPYAIINVTEWESFNTTPTTTADPPPEPLDTWKVVLIVIVCSIFIIGTIVGNLLVFLSVGIVKKLRTPSNLLIVSLAAADFLVGTIVMPFAVVNTVMVEWVLGQGACDAWTSSDVLLCTASILNLCVISIDRYLVITKPFEYAIKRTPKRMAMMITAVWVLSALISIPPLFGWKDENRPDTVCVVSQDKYYQLYATMLSFYIPLSAMIFVYFKIYQVSHKIAKEEAKSKPRRDTTIGDMSGATTPLRRDSEEPGTAALRNGGGAKKSDGSGSSADAIPKIQVEHSQNSSNKKTKIPVFKKYTLKGKESKAVKTLGIIMGAFTVCWLPFFILALIAPFCNQCIPDSMHTITLWLGYTNSFLNPIIYARFNRDFRKPFKEILLCKCCHINDRLRHELYSERYGGASVRNSLRPPQHSVVKYQSQGQTVVELGNGEIKSNTDASKL